MFGPKKFDLKQNDYEKIMNYVTDKCNLGLNRKPETPVNERGLPMQPSEVTHFSVLRSETFGLYFAIDLCPSYIRIVPVIVDPPGEPVGDHKVSYPKEASTWNCEQLFNFVSESLDSFIYAVYLTNKLRDHTVPIGVKVSFPCLDNASDKFPANILKGANIKDCFSAGMKRIGHEFHHITVSNEAAATLGFCSMTTENLRISVTLLDVFDAAYIEQACKLAVTPKTDEAKLNELAVTTGLSCLDGGFLKYFCNEVDYELDNISQNPNKNIIEKMILMPHLTELVRIGMLKLIQQGQIFDGKLPSLLKEKNSIPIDFLSDASQNETAVKKHLNIKSAVPKKDLILIRSLINSIVDRSAGITGACIASLLKRLNSKEKVKIPVGCTSLLKLGNRFSAQLNKTIAALVPDLKFQLYLCDLGSETYGSAIVGRHCLC